jgi:hypothetical protein
MTNLSPLRRRPASGLRHHLTASTPIERRLPIRRQSVPRAVVIPEEDWEQELDADLVRELRHFLGR